VIAHELTHRFLGGKVRLASKRGGEAQWFAEGFTMHAARRALFEAGLLTPVDFAADASRVVGSAEEAEELPTEYRRGAALAAWLDAEIARATQGKEALSDVLHDLTARGGTLPVAALVDALGAHAPAAAASLAAATLRVDAGKEAPDLPDDAFGPCVRPRAKERTVFDLGLDAASLRASPAMVRGLVQGSRAQRAGLVEGALVLRSRVPPEAEALNDEHAEVDLALGDGRRVRYRPIATRRERVWEAVPGPACAAPRRDQSSR
jgi:predicted metalloprotease with PDZ domain